MNDQRKATPHRDADISRECRELIERERLAAIRSTTLVFAHEVGNKVNNVSLQAQMLDRELRKESHPLLARSQSVLASIQALRELLERLGALDDGRASQPSSVDLPELVAEVCKLERWTPVGSGVRVVQRATREVPPVRACVEDVRQIVAHLCRNALEAMPDGGTLTIEIGRSGDGDVTLTLEDTGPGVAPDVDVFRPFQTTKSHRFGLGLSFVRHLAKRQGGSVRHHSNLGEGAQFVVTLPADLA